MFKRVLNYLERTSVIKTQLMTYICILNVYESIKTHYQRAYSAPVGRPNKLPFSCGHAKWPASYWYILLFRRFTVSWAVYVVVRQLFSARIETILRRYFKLELPIHCYLLGRYVLDEKIEDEFVVTLGMALVIWTAMERFSKPYNMSTAYFLLLDEHELDAIYSMLGPNKSIVLVFQQINELSAKDRLLLDTMFHRHRQRTSVVYRLRSNRTREAHQELRRFLAKLTFITVAFNSILAVIIAAVVIHIIMTDAHYLREYPNCFPKLERLKAEGRLTQDSITLAGHHLVAAVGDIWENVVFWLEPCLLATYVPVTANLCAQDLLIQWRSIDQRIRRLKQQAERCCLGWLRRNDNSVQAVAAGGMYESDLTALFDEISDFFENVDKANVYMSDWLNNFVGWCFVLCISYTYLTQVKGIQQISFSIAFVMCYIAMGVAGGSYASVVVHKICTRTYPSLCSLMAYDLSRIKRNFWPIIELFAEERSCFILFHQYRFKTATLLTATGWAFSLFCISAGLLQKGIIAGYHHRPRQEL
jgi:hypothetical protein